MREDNLLAVQPRAVVITTDAQHDLQVFLNLASRLTLTGINQLRVADITYIRLRAEFVYLAVRLDAYSRKVVGWALDRTLAANLQPDSSAQCAGLSTTRTGKHRAAMRLTHIAAGTITGGRSDGVKKFNISGVLFNI
jgi:transposase InsO family protein